MKRLKGTLQIIFFTVLVVLLCGCSNNKLDCAVTIDNSLHELKITFKENVPSKATYQIKYTYRIDDAYIDMKALELQEQFAFLDDVDGVSYSIKEKDSSLIVKIKIDYTKGAKELENIPILFDSLENNKLDLESKRYQCK